jgi:hypothetical protein
MRVLLYLALTCLALLALDRLALWMEGRGWLYYRRRKPSTTTLGNAFLEVQALLEPDKQTLLEVRRGEEVDDEESGDPPEPGIADDATVDGGHRDGGM